MARDTALVRAPELRGRGWLNTGGAQLSLAGLRGRVVVLDFWTFCCVNCLHVLDELREVEERFADRLTLIGVHSPKFTHEADPEALAAAVQRYAVRHPVLDDPELETWKAYTARAWPTLVVIDPEGYIVAHMSGEGHGPGLATLIEELIAEHEAKGTLRSGEGPYVAPPALESTLQFPGKVVPGDDGTWLVSDTAGHSIVRLDADLETELARWGGPGELNEPQGLCRLPGDVAQRVGYDVVIADSVNHRIVGLSLSEGTLIPLAGTGEQLRERSGGGAALRQALSTPWDVAWWQDRIVIAMAGTHQLWALHLATDPADNTVAVLAGTSEEGLRDGPGLDAWLAQPSGLAVSRDPERLWVIDAETSAVRSLRVDDQHGFVIQTHVGQGLFDFGHVDGPGDRALLQHPLGACELGDGRLVVCDTYNGALRIVDDSGAGPAQVSTLATGLAEPSGVALIPGEDARVVVVESAAHRLRSVEITEAQEINGPALSTSRPPTTLPAGPVVVEVAFTAPYGQHLDHRWGDPTMLSISATPASALLAGGGSAPGLRREITLEQGFTAAVLHVSVQAAACDGDPETGELAEHAACHLFQQDWGIPLEEGGAEGGALPALRLDLRGDLRR